MMIEQEMVVVKAQDLEEYKAKHSAAEPLPEVHFFSTKIPENAFDRERNVALQKENAKLRVENTRLIQQNEELVKRYNELERLRQEGRNKADKRFIDRMAEYENRISKLEKALVEATIR